MILCAPNNVTVIRPPVVEPVSLDDARRQIGLSEENDEHNLFIHQKISTARRVIEKRLNVTMVETKLRGVWRNAPRVLQLPAPPLLFDQDHPVSVSIDGVALTEGEFSVDADVWPGELELPRGGKAIVEWWAGADPNALLCPMLHSAILMYVDHAFRNRGVLADDQTIVLPCGFDDLLAASSWSGRW